MGSDVGAAPRYIVRISRSGAESFGWEILREADSIAIEHSTRPLPTRVDAILDSARVAATLGISIDESSSVEGKSQGGD
jgi:hypothetical protein